MEAIHCCLCGVATKPYKGGMCLDCLRKEIDIKEGIPTQYDVIFCPDCNKYLTITKTYVYVERESVEMMGLLLKYLRKTSDIELKDASFIYTEPHSRRIKIKIVIQKTTEEGLIIQDNMVIEFKEIPRMCVPCQKIQTGTDHEAIVQIRQRVKHKKTLLYLEQLILHNYCKHNTVTCETVAGGMDFYFATLVQANIFASFVTHSVPCKSNTARQYKSIDVRSNIESWETTICLTVPDVCKNDLCVLDKSQYNMLKQLGNVVICHHISSSLHFISPLSGEKAVVTMEIFNKNPIQPTYTSDLMSEFIVIEIDKPYVTVCRDSDFGVNDDKYTTKTFLCDYLTEGDIVIGYFVKSMMMGDNYQSCTKEEFQDVYLVKKKVEKRKHTENKKFDHLKTKSQPLGEKGDMEVLLDDLEDDEMMRTAIQS